MKFVVLLRRRFASRFDHLVQDLSEILEPGRGNNNGIPPSTDVFRNPQKTAPRILLQREHKCLALNLDLVGLQRFFIYGRPGLAIRPTAVR